MVFSFRSYETGVGLVSYEAMSESVPLLHLVNTPYSLMCRGVDVFKCICMYIRMKNRSTPPLVDFACAAQTLRKASRLISKRYEDGFRKVNLTASQFSILQALTYAKEMPFGRISDVLGLDQTTLSRLLKTLEKRQLVAVQPDKNDARGRTVSSTVAGKELFEEAELIWRSINDDSLSRLSDDDWQTVKRALNVLTN